MDWFEAKYSLAIEVPGPPSTLVSLIHLAWRVGKCLRVVRQPLLGGLYARGSLLEQPWRRPPPLSRVPGHPWFSQQFQNKPRQMTLHIADLCLGTDKDWKVGKTKIFLKVRCCEALLPLASWRQWEGHGKEPQPATPAPVLSWAVGSSSHRLMHWLAP